MSKKQQNDSNLSIIKNFYNKAKGHSAFYDSENNESRNLEAFLLLSVLFEKVLTTFGLSLLDKNPELTALKDKRKERYNIDNAINDIYLLKEISTTEFTQLHKFKKDRNDCIHHIFNKRQESIEKDIKDLFKEHSPTFEIILKKCTQHL